MGVQSFDAGQVLLYTKGLDEGVPWGEPSLARDRAIARLVQEQIEDVLGNPESPYTRISFPFLLDLDMGEQLYPSSYFAPPFIDGEASRPYIGHFTREVLWGPEHIYRAIIDIEANEAVQRYRPIRLMEVTKYNYFLPHFLFFGAIVSSKGAIFGVNPIPVLIFRQDFHPLIILDDYKRKAWSRLARSRRLH